MSRAVSIWIKATTLQRASFSEMLHNFGHIPKIVLHIKCVCHRNQHILKGEFGMTQSLTTGTLSCLIIIFGFYFYKVWLQRCFCIWGQDPNHWKKLNFIFRFFNINIINNTSRWLQEWRLGETFWLR